MVSLERKFDILHHSIATFTRWLDSCTPLLDSLSTSQTSLESGQDEKADSKLRDLALQYKVSTIYHLSPIPIPAAVKYTFICMYMYIYMYMYITCTCTCVCACVHCILYIVYIVCTLYIHVQYRCTCIHVHVHACVCRPHSYTHASSRTCCYRSRTSVAIWVRLTTSAKRYETRPKTNDRYKDMPKPTKLSIR